MLIDWFTLIAQLFNFLILVWLLKRFLYKPVLRVIDEREQRIAGQLRDADLAQKEAALEKEAFSQKNSEFEQNRQKMSDSVAKEVDLHRQKMLEQVRVDIDKFRQGMQETLINEQRNLSAEIRHHTQAEVISISRKTLNDLASVELEDQMAKVFIDRLKKLDAKEKESLLSAITKVQGIVVVRSTFELSSVNRERVDNFIHKDLFYEAEVKYETAPYLISGMELIAGGYKIGWSIDNYIESFEKHLSELIESKS